MNTILVIILIIVTGIGVTSALLKYSATTKEAIAAFQAVLAIFGLLLGGYWYFIERKGEPHIDLTQTAVAERVAPGAAIVEATISVKNLGTTLVHLRSADIRLQQVLPWPTWALPIERLTSLGFAEWPNLINIEGKDRPAFHEAELQWPTLKRFASEINHEVEPGETDTVTATFIVPCSVATVRVATAIRRTDEDPMRRQQWELTRRVVGWFRLAQAKSTDTATPVDWWKVRTFVDVKSACQPKKDEKR